MFVESLRLPPFEASISQDWLTPCYSHLLSFKLELMSRYVSKDMPLSGWLPTFLKLLNPRQGSPLSSPPFWVLTSSDVSSCRLALFTPAFIFHFVHFLTTNVHAPESSSSSSKSWDSRDYTIASALGAIGIVGILVCVVVVPRYLKKRATTSRNVTPSAGAEEQRGVIIGETTEIATQ